MRSRGICPSIPSVSTALQLDWLQKNQRWGIFQYIKMSQRLFLENLGQHFFIFFRDLLIFRLAWKKPKSRLYANHIGRNCGQPHLGFIFPAMVLQCDVIRISTNGREERRRSRSFQKDGEHLLAVRLLFVCCAVGLSQLTSHSATMVKRSL